MADINWLQEVPSEDISVNAVDPLGDEVIRRFNGAVAWQSSEMVNGIPLRQCLQNCWEQLNGVMSAEDRERAEALGVNAMVNLTALKCGIANAYLTDSLTSGTSQLPWVIQPTPRPDISPVAADEILQELKTALFAGGIQSGAQMVEAVKMLKKVQKRREEEKAKKSAEEMTLLIEDQCVEGGFQRALTDLLQYFPVYPYAVFAGPYITRAPRIVWGKNKPRIATEVFPTFRAISPFDFCYSPDSPDTQRGTCVFTRTLWTRRELLDAAQMTSYLQENVLEVLTQCDTNPDFNLSWLSRSPDDPKRNLSLWSSNVAPIEVLTHYGVMSGRELSKYNFSGLNDTEFYNCEIAMAGYRVIQVRVISDPRMQTRPIYTASFYRTGGDRIAGDGIAQRLRDIERAYISCLQYLMRNAANASAPLCEADYRRLSKYMTDEDLGHVVPGLMYLSESDTANNSPALRFFNIPSNIPAYAQLMEMFMQIADRVSNIPASLHGEAVGSGAMRTFRGMSMLQGNATKALHAAVTNLSNGIFMPLGTNLYNTNMLYAKDSDVKGDSQILAKGVEGLLQKEMEKQSAMELLQVVGAVGAQLGQVVNLSPVVSWSIKKLMGSMGVPDDILEQMGAVPVMPGAMTAGGAPNPAPPSPTGEGVAADTAGMGMQ